MRHSLNTWIDRILPQIRLRWASSQARMAAWWRETRPNKNRSRTKRRLAFESLEDRKMMAVDVFFASSNFAAFEQGPQAASVTVLLSAPATEAFTVPYIIDGGSTASPSEYTLSGSLDFAVGETQKVITLTPVDDAEVENDETVTLQLLEDSTSGSGTAAYTLGGSSSATVTIIDNEVNEAPVLGSIGDQTVDEGTELTFTATATDSDVPANTLTYSLDSGAPSGANIDSTTGVFTWTPTEAQGQETYNVTVRVTDDGAPNLDDFETITITVNEVNEAPVLGSIGDQTVDEGTELTFTAMATETDLPANTLTYSLDSGAPSGANIDSTTGVFTWTPSEAQGAGTYNVTVRVTDDGSPNLDDFESITITVNEVNEAAEVQIF